MRGREAVLWTLALFAVIGGANYCAAQQDTGVGGGFEDECISDSPFRAGC